MPEFNIPEKIGPLPTGVVVLVVGAAVGIFVVLRSRGGSTSGATVPSTTATLPTPTGGGGGGGTTTTTPTTSPTFTEAGILAAWVQASDALKARTTDPAKIQNRQGGSFLDLMKYLTANPTELAAMPEAVRTAITQLPAAWFLWIQGISNKYDAAKRALVAETGQGYFSYVNLPDLINILRSYPEFMARHPEFADLLTLPISPSTTGTQPPTTTATTTAPSGPSIAPTAPATWELPGGLSLPDPISKIMGEPVKVLPSIPGPGSNPMFTPTQTPAISLVQTPSKPTPLTSATGLKLLAENLVLGS